LFKKYTVKTKYVYVSLKI